MDESRSSCLHEILPFNITNPEEFSQGQESPNVTEVGPFVFQEVRTKNVDGLSKDLSTVFYSDERAFVFDQELSGASLDDEITFINVPVNVSCRKIEIFLENESKTQCF